MLSLKNSSNTNYLKITNKILTSVLVLLSVVLIVRFLYFEYNLLQYPYQWSVLEALHLNHAIILSEGKELYAISKEPPLVIEIYGPLFPALVAPLIKIFGKSLFAPRLAAFICFLLLLFLIAYIVFSLTRRWYLALISVGLSTLMAQWWQWILICRPDGIGYLLLFLMLFIHWKFPFNKTAIFFCLMTGIIAFFAKVYFVCGFAGIVLSYWIIHKNRKYAISFLILGGGLLIAAVVIANYLTNGLYYLITFEMESYWVPLFLPFSS